MTTGYWSGHTTRIREGTVLFQSKVRPIRCHSFLNLTKVHNTFIGKPNIFPALCLFFLINIACMCICIYIQIMILRIKLFLSYTCLTYVSTMCGTDTEPKHHVWLTQHSDLKDRWLGILKRLEAWSFVIFQCTLFDSFSYVPLYS